MASLGLQNKNVVMTGFRDDQLAKQIEKQGGHVKTSVGNQTDIVIVKDGSNRFTLKVEQAAHRGIPIYSKSKFIHRFIE